MYRKEEEKIKSGFDSVAPNLFQKIKQREYKKIESEEELFGELNFQEKHKYNQKKPVALYQPRVALGSIAAVVLCFLICIQLFAPKVQATRIMIDVNSGIQFMVTEKNQKTEIVALSAASEKIAEGVSEGRTLEEAVYELLENLNHQEYFQESDAGMLVSYMNQEKDDSKKKISSVICQYFKEQNLSVALVQQEVEEKSKLQKEADEQGVSLGKYCFLKTLQEEYKIDARSMYQKGMGDILQEIDQQGIDLSQDTRIEYLSGEQVTTKIELASETNTPDEDPIMTSNDEKGKKTSEDILEENTKGKTKKNTLGEKKAQTKKKTEVPANHKPEAEKDQKENISKDKVPASPVTSPAPGSAQAVPVEGSQQKVDTTGTITATTEPAEAPPVQNPQENDKDKQGQEKTQEEKKDSPGGIPNAEKEQDLSHSDKDQTLDCGVDDIKEQIKEYMKNHPHSKKGYEQLYAECCLENGNEVQVKETDK